jgi:hypothetical protein
MPLSRRISFPQFVILRREAAHIRIRLISEALLFIISIRASAFVVLRFIQYTTFIIRHYHYAIYTLILVVLHYEASHIIRWHYRCRMPRHYQDTLVFIVNNANRHLTDGLNIPSEYHIRHTTAIPRARVLLRLLPEPAAIIACLYCRYYMNIIHYTLRIPATLIILHDCSPKVILRHYMNITPLSHRSRAMPLRWCFTYDTHIRLRQLFNTQPARWCSAITIALARERL